MPPATARSAEPQTPARFPLALAMAGIIATGLALLASALGIQWGAAPPAPDALELAWPYVNVAMVMTWLLVWPALTLKKASPPRAALAWQLLTLAIATLPAMGVSTFLHSAAPQTLATTAALQLSIGLLAMAVMLHAGRLGVTTVAGALASLAVALPLAGYLWSEFFPAAWQGWIAWIPAFAATRAALAPEGTWWIIAGYGTVALALLATAPRSASPTP